MKGVPHTSQNFLLTNRTFMKMRLLCAVLVLFVFRSCSTEVIEDTSTVAIKAKNISKIETELLSIVNNHRNSMDLISLDFSEVAYDHANLHTDYMISVGAINHDNFNSRASKISLETNAKSVSENVAKNFTTASAALNNWLTSPEHRKTIEGEFTHTGVSVKQDSSGKLYFTQLFYK